MVLAIVLNCLGYFRYVYDDDDDGPVRRLRPLWYIINPLYRSVDLPVLLHVDVEVSTYYD